MTLEDAISHAATAVAGAIGGIGSMLVAKRKGNADAKKVEADAAETLVGVSTDVVTMLERNMERMQKEITALRAENRGLHVEVAALRKQIEGLQSELARRR